MLFFNIYKMKNKNKIINILHMDLNNNFLK